MENGIESMEGSDMQKIGGSGRREIGVVVSVDGDIVKESRRQIVNIGRKGERERVKEVWTGRKGKSGI
jgi:hypothetical protein